MKRHIRIYILMLILTSCGIQKEFLGISDKIAKDYLNPRFGNEMILINEPLYESILAAINDKYNYYKDYNSSPLYPTVGDTLKRIFSEKNIEFFKAQLKKQIKWAEKSYVKQTIIDLVDMSKRSYNNKTIFSLSYPVITHDKKFALMQSSSYHRRLMAGSNELLILKKQKNKWVIYKRFELSLQ